MSVVLIDGYNPPLHTVSLEEENLASWTGTLIVEAFLCLTTLQSVRMWYLVYFISPSPTDRNKARIFISA